MLKNCWETDNKTDFTAFKSMVFTYGFSVFTK